MVNLNTFEGLNTFLKLKIALLKYHGYKVVHDTRNTVLLMTVFPLVHVKSLGPLLLGSGAILSSVLWV